MNGHADDLYDYDDDFQHNQDQDDYQQTTTNVNNNNNDEGNDNNGFLVDENISNDGMMPQDLGHDVADEQLLETKLRLKAAMHYFIGKIAEHNQSTRAIPNFMQVSKQTIASLNELVYALAENLGKDIESFAKHAKRSMVNTDDIKLCARRNPSIIAKLNEYHVSIGGVEEKKPVQKRKRVSKKDKEQMDDIAAQMKSDSNDATDNNPSNIDVQSDVPKPAISPPVVGVANFTSFANTKGKLKLHKATDD